MVRIVEADAEIYPLEKKEDICTHIERCGRTCYKSENMITNETAVPFINGILKAATNRLLNTPTLFLPCRTYRRIAGF